ncbi:hypothetical protein JL722_1782 [Aureococcus anophagefferens]|nr:hypothetical protein JL722_1782 [Aureococcus anophagefferens]
MDETSKLVPPAPAALDRSVSVAESYQASLEGGAARREALRGARASVYMYQFWGSAGWGIWNICYTYYLQDVGGYSSGVAANYATGEWIAYALVPVFDDAHEAEASDGASLDTLEDAWRCAREGVKIQARVPMLLRDRRSALLTADFMIYLVLTGIFDLCLFWGERKFDWDVGITTGYLMIVTVAPAVGAFLGTRVLFPSRLKYAKSIALLLAASAAGSVLEGLVPDSTAAVAIVPLASFGWGVYPSITALLTPDEAHANQGHLQGALFAITTLGSVVALGLYLLVYDLTLPSADSGTYRAPRLRTMTAGTETCVKVVVRCRPLLGHEDGALDVSKIDEAGGSIKIGDKTHKRAAGRRTRWARLRDEPDGAAAVVDIMARRAALLAAGDRDCGVVLSLCEVYNEEVRDLLADRGGGALKVQDAAEGGGARIAGLSERVVESADAVYALTRDGMRRRATGSTNMNEHSSRSHMILSFRVEVGASADGASSKTCSKLHLVDLAGSERAKRTGATGDRLREGIQINSSLLALGNVIARLVELQGKGGGGRDGHVPYRDSALTRLLSDSLGGTAHTTMIAQRRPPDSDESDGESDDDDDELEQERKLATLALEEKCMDSLKQHYERAIEKLEAEVAALEIERRDLAERTRSTESEAATRVLREKARKLELHIARLRGEARKATGEVQRCAQLKDRAERDARALRAEVEEARKRRGELQRRLQRKDADHAKESRSWKREAKRLQRDNDRVKGERRAQDKAAHRSWLNGERKYKQRQTPKQRQSETLNALMAGVHSIAGGAFSPRSEPAADDVAAAAPPPPPPPRRASRRRAGDGDDAAAQGRRRHRREPPAPLPPPDGSPPCPWPSASTRAAARASATPRPKLAAAAPPPAPPRPPGDAAGLDDLDLKMGDLMTVVAAVRRDRGLPPPDAGPPGDPRALRDVVERNYAKPWQADQPPPPPGSRFSDVEIAEEIAAREAIGASS